MAAPDRTQIEEALAQSAVEPASSSVDGESVTALDPLKAIQIADRLAAKEALSGTNSRGGRKSAWGKTRMAIAVPRSGR
jgi:hypothetical protein